MRKKYSFYSFLLPFGSMILLPLIIFAVGVGQACAESIDTLHTREVFLLKGELETLKVHSLTRLSLTDPDVTDIVSADDRELLIIGRKKGQSAIFIWDEHGKRTIMVNVYNQQLNLVKQRLEKLLQTADLDHVRVSINEEEGKVVLTGNIPPHLSSKFDLITEPFEENLLVIAKAEDVEELVQIDIQITELNQTLEKTLGFDWTTDAASGGLLFSYPEEFPDDIDGKPADWFKIGDFGRSTAMTAAINALLNEGKARILSNPKLVMKNGTEAKFLVGGEIPIRTTSVTGDTSTETISYKEYGISMVVEPTIKKEQIDLRINVEVSEVDTTTANAGASGTVAFLTRNASTQLLLDDGQTIILAGLIKKTDSENISKVPFLGDIPILGALFRKKSSPDNRDQELVISIRPTVLTERGEELARKDSRRSEDRFSAAASSLDLKDTKEMVVQETPEAGLDEGSTDISSEEKTKQEPTQEDLALESKEAITSSAETESPEIALDVQKTKPADKKYYPKGFRYKGIPEEMNNYIQSVQENISRSIIYPSEAWESGWEGTVKLNLLILKDGTLAYALLKESSGHQIFDESAIRTAKNIAPYSSFPPGADLQELNVTIPIVYSLREE